MNISKKVSYISSDFISFFSEIVEWKMREKERIFQNSCIHIKNSKKKM